MIELETEGAWKGIPRSEVVLASCVLVDPRAIDRVETVVEPRDFTDQRLRRVWVAMLHLRRNGSPIDEHSVGAYLQADDDLQHDLLDLGVVTSTATHIEHHAAIVARAAHLRRARAAAEEADRRLADANPADEDETADALREASDAFDAACNPRGRVGDDGAVSLLDAVTGARHLAAERAEVRARGEEPEGVISTGHPELDQLIGGGLWPGETYGLGAREKEGKSSFMLQLAEEVAARHLGVVVFSYEVSAPDLGARVLAAHAETTVADIRQGLVLPAAQARMLAVEQQTLSAWAGAVRVRHCPGWTMEQIEHEVMRYLRSDLQQRFPLGMVVVDHIGRVGASKNHRGLSPMDRLYDIAERFTTLNAQANSIGLLLTQHNRDWRSRPNKAPVQTDVRGAAAIAELCQALLQIYRPIMNGDPNERDPRVAYIHATLTRSGRPGRAAAIFDPPAQRFRPRPPDPPGQAHYTSGYGGSR